MQAEETKRLEQERERLKREDEERQNVLKRLSDMSIEQREMLEQEAKTLAKSRCGIVTRLSIEIELENLIVQKVKGVRVIYKGEEGKDVKIAGEWNGWIPEKMDQNENGQWKKDLELLAGEYKYKLIVDDEWKTNPDGELADDLQENNRIVS